MRRVARVQFPCPDLLRSREPRLYIHTTSNNISICVCNLFERVALPAGAGRVLSLSDIFLHLC